MPSKKKKFLVLRQNKPKQFPIKTLEVVHDEVTAFDRNERRKAKRLADQSKGGYKR